MKSKVYIINLEKRNDRKVAMQKQIKQLSIRNYEFISAIDGEELKNEQYPLPDYINREHLGEKYQKHFNNTEIACIQSHIKAIEKAKESNLDYVIILEDDVVLCDDWNKRLDKLLKLTPRSWNHIYLSGEPNEKERKTNPLNLAPFLHVEKSINTMGAFSYILKNEVYDLVINELKKYTLPIDDVIKHMIEKGILKSYTFYPFLSYHENEIPSSIWDRKIWEREYYYEHESKRYFVKKI